MDAAKRKEIWEAYFEADFRSRYFLLLADRLRSRIQYVSLAIAILSCGPIANAFWQFGYGQVLAGLSGALAGLLGLYLATMGLPRALATAIRASATWSQAASRFRELWVRLESGEDVWHEYRRLDEELTRIDAVTIEDLSTDDTLIQKAWEGSRRSLAPA